MYQVIVVEDEPAAAEHICSLLALHAPRFQVAGRAGNGREALELLGRTAADVVITDIRMPVMDGLNLARELHARHPDLCTLVLSGYQEFDYAREALQADVFDYLLKPLSPATLRECLTRVEERLRKGTAQRQAQLLRSLSHSRDEDSAEVRRCFAEPAYYAALVRKNGLPRRLYPGAPHELYSQEGELMRLYGRDEMESLCLSPAVHLDLDEFRQMAGRVLDPAVPGYVTLVLYPDSFSPDHLPTVVHRLYDTLHACVRVGVHQEVVAEKNVLSVEELTVAEELSLLELHLQKQDRSALREVLEQLLSRWQRQRRPQLAMERAVKHILQQLCIGELLSFDESVDFLVEDLFYSATALEELADSLYDLLIKSMPSADNTGAKIDSPAFFGKIRDYVEANLAQPLMLQSLCKRFGVSQTYLSRLFRKHTGQSYNEYLTAVRMERAKALLLEQEGILIREVASLVGYNDQFYFSRLFRSVTGSTPTEYAGAHGLPKG